MSDAKELKKKKVYIVFGCKKMKEARWVKGIDMGTIRTKV